MNVTDEQMISELDAYGHLTWTMGDMDWMVCFDAVRHGDRIAYQAVVNCESGGFIDTIEKGVIPVSEGAALLDLPERYLDAGLEGHYQARGQRLPVGHFAWKDCERSWKRHIKNLIAV
jgi:hypothetical protein